MAFTLAHMAAALPFYRKRGLCFEALLIGTMIPDLPYYMGSSEKLADQTHQWIGIISYGIPVGLIVFVCWYWGIKPALMALVAPFSGYFFAHKHTQSLSGFMLSVIVALALGAATHLIWDGITHSDGSIAKHIDWLQYQIYTYPFKGTTVARLLQYISSAAGLLVLLLFGLSLIRRAASCRASSLRYRFKPDLVFNKTQSLMVVGALMLLSLLWGLIVLIKNYWILSISPYTFAANVLVSSIQGTALLVIGFSVLYHLIKSR